VSELTVIAKADGATVVGFQDPDGNSSAVQEINARLATAHPERSRRSQHGLADDREESEFAIVSRIANIGPHSGRPLGLTQAV
jgi:hypothetical protein